MPVPRKLPFLGGQGDKTRSGGFGGLAVRRTPGLFVCRKKGNYSKVKDATTEQTQRLCKVIYLKPASSKSLMVYLYF